MSREEYEAKRAARPDIFPDIYGIKGAAPCNLVPHPERQQDSVDESVAAIPREAPRQGRVRIIVSSYRLSLLDDDNLALGAKPLIDCCVSAGWLPSDAKIWCQIEHRQEKVDDPCQERTEMTLEFPPEN